jgi:hypothetical protein
MARRLRQPCPSRSLIRCAPRVRLCACARQPETAQPLLDAAVADRAQVHEPRGRNADRIPELSAISFAPGADSGVFTP